MQNTIEFIDLLALLKAYKGKGLQRVGAYGRITKKLPRPVNLQDSLIESPNGIFVEMELFAINLKYYEAYLRSNGYYNKDSIYMVNGSIITFVENTTKLGVDWFTVFGTLRLGSRDINDPYTCMFNFRKQGNAWYLDTLPVSDVELSDWDRNGSCYAWINESGRVNQVLHPKEVLALPRVNSLLKQTYQPVRQAVGTPVNTETLMPSTTIVKRAFNKENRQSIKEYNSYVDKFKDILCNSKTSKQNFIRDLKTEYSANETTDYYLSYMLDGISMHLKNKVAPQAMTGRVLLKKYLNNFSDSEKKYIGNRSASEYLIEIWDEVKSYILDHDTVVTADGVAWELCTSAFGNVDLFYAEIVGIVVGFSFETIYSIWETCHKANISLIKILNENPYILQFVSSLSFNDIEKIALCFNQHCNQNLTKYKNIAMLNAFIEDSQDGSTIFTKDSLSKSSIGLTLTQAKYNNMCNRGTFLTDSLLLNITCFIKDVSHDTLGYDKYDFRKVGYNYVKIMPLQDLLIAISQYSETGLGVVLDNYVTSSKLLNEELFVFKTMYEMGSQTFDYSHEDIDSYIKEYESIVGFTLEERQNMAVHLLVNGAFIVAGGAGSGKTTVSNCVVYVLRKLEPALDIKFIAPTGKAAKRMQEVVKQPVKTIHSEFKLGMKEDNLFTLDDEKASKSRLAYFCDEGGMITIDTLYKALKHLDVKYMRFFLFGDFGQLPPIGKGLPFKNLLRFLPCVFLNVSKRAVDGSHITANSNYINECSDASNWHDLESEDDFFLLPCKEQDIQRVTYNLCAYYLGKPVNVDYIKKYLGISELPEIPNLTPDDIQVVSPLQKANYSWGSTKLNEILQPLFNPEKNIHKKFLNQLTQAIPGHKFTIGDRVIHTDANMYAMQWYSSYKYGELQKIYGSGICNGDVGKIVDILKADDCMILDEVEEKPDDFEYGNLRDDTTWHGDDAYFIVVEYFDYMSSRNYYILYRATFNPRVQSNEVGLVLVGEDLNKLNLFYAGTTHKLQGSQAKLIIFTLGVVNFKGFITRQMLYTMVTRGEDLVFGVGSVGNEQSSMLSQARRDIASVDVKTVGELLV